MNSILEFDIVPRPASCSPSAAGRMPGGDENFDRLGGKIIMAVDARGKFFDSHYPDRLD